ncbi:MAG: ABC transporter ATP-binding protein [Lachnospiraceae bacterium]|nr:ABC transporter ATP-binding protein [Lachnospiraceae bacterium]
MPEQDKILEVENLHVEYSSGDDVVRAVNGVSFSLEWGKTLGIVGETGAGKTTIAKAILQILPSIQARITEGRILFNGEDLLKADEKKMMSVRGAQISMIFQDPMTSLNPLMRVGRQISEGIQLHQNVSRKEADKRAAQLLERVGIPASRFREYPLQFSGGMKQRVVIAIALACNPELLIADEPTSALDVTIQAQVMNLIRELQAEYQASVVMITHDFGIVAESCDTVAVVYAGQIVEYGTKEQLFKNPSHPYTLGLFGALPGIDTGRQRLHPIKGAPVDPTRLPAGCPFAARCEYASDECRAGGITAVDIGDGHLCRCLYAGKLGRKEETDTADGKEERKGDA